jgi:hypothetical protein
MFASFRFRGTVVWTLLVLLCATLTACESNGTGAQPAGRLLCARAAAMGGSSPTPSIDTVGGPGCLGTLILPADMCGGGPPLDLYRSLDLTWDDNTTLWYRTSATPSPTNVTFSVPGNAVAGSTHALRLRCRQTLPQEPSPGPPYDLAGYQSQFSVTKLTMTDRVTARPGQPVTVEVSGLSCATTRSADQSVVVEWNSTALGDPVTIKEPYAAFTISPRVPQDASAGTEAKLTVRCAAAAQPAAVTTVTVASIPRYLRADIPTATPGKPFTVSGTGLDCSAHRDQTVGIYFGASDGPPLVGRTEHPVVSVDQGFTARVVLPIDAAPDTEYELNAFCNAGTDGIESTIRTSRPTAMLTVSPPIGVSGAPVGLTVAGLYCHAGTDGVARMTVRWDGGAVLDRLSGTNSAFTTYRFKVGVPAATPGQHRFTVSCGTGQNGYDGSVSTAFQVTPTEVRVQPSTMSALVGQSKAVHVTGVSCVDGSTDALVVSWDSDKLMTLPWDKVSGADLLVSIPQTTAGVHTLAIGCDRGVSRKQVKVFVPGITLGAASGAAGGSVTVSGAGFLCQNGKANVAWDKEKPRVAAVQADGAFTTQFAAPTVVGPHQITASCNGSPTPAALSFIVTAATVQVNPPKAAAGQHVTLHASFIPSSCKEFSIALGQQPVVPPSPAVIDDALNGRTIDLDLTVPDGAKTGPTSYTLTCRGGQANSFAADFEVLAAPVPAADEGIDLTGVLATLAALVLAAVTAYAINQRARGPGSGGAPGIQVTVRLRSARISIGPQS